jgi:stringent starvation protein B
MSEVSTKPYLVRAIHEWCTDAGFTPYVAVAVDESVRVPMDFVKNGEIVLNVSSLATNRLTIDNEQISFQARFGGVPRDVYVPITRVIAIYARENGQGMAFEVPRALAPAGVEAAPAGTAVTARERTALVPLALATRAAADDAQASDDSPEPPPAPKAGGDRPRLTRVK